MISNASAPEDYATEHDISFTEGDESGKFITRLRRNEDGDNVEKSLEWLRDDISSYLEDLNYNEIRIKGKGDKIRIIPHAKIRLAFSVNSTNHWIYDGFHFLQSKLELGALLLIVVFLFLVCIFALVGVRVFLLLFVRGCGCCVRFRRVGRSGLRELLGEHACDQSRQRPDLLLYVQGREDWVGGCV